MYIFHNKLSIAEYFQIKNFNIIIWPINPSIHVELVFYYLLNTKMYTVWHKHYKIHDKSFI